jgi:hypothetical protein
MRNYRNAVAALVLALMLSPLAYAGDGIMYPERTPPPPPPSTSSMTTDGVMTTGVAGQDTTGSDATAASSSLTETALNLLQSVLSLF